MSNQPPDATPTPDEDIDPSLLKLSTQNRNKNRSKRSPEWIFFADAGMWQTVNGEESKFRIANCRYCLKADIETKIRGKIETMKNHILECDKIPASQKAVYERHPGRHRKRQSSAPVDPAKRQKFDGLLKGNALSHLDGVENKAVVLHGVGDMRIDRVPIPAIPSGHVLVSMRSVGICGSDVHYWCDGRIGDFVVQKPMVLGHEGSGVVRLVGADVEGLEEGDRVAIEPGVPCASCCNCKGGRYNLCASVKFAATPPVNGCLAHFVMHPASFCYKLPPMISFDEAALFEPLSVGIHACKRGNVKLGDIVLITGAGPIGLVTMLVAKASGASQVIILDIDAERLQVAKELGADRVISTHIAGDPKVTVEGIEADICVDATGVESAIRTCVYAAKRGGVVVIVGMGKPDVSLPVLEIGIKEIDIRGVFRYCNTYPIALELVASGKVQMKRLVTHRFKMFESADAFEAARDRSSKSIKVIIDCAPPPTVQGHGISSAAMHALGVPKSDLSGVTGQTVHTLSVQKQEMCTEAAPSAIISATMPATNTAATGITANGISTSGICGSGIPAGAIPTAGMAAGAISPTGIPATGDSKIGVRSTAVAAQGVHAGVISAQVVTSTGIHTPVLPTGGVPATDISTIGVPAASVAISGESAPDIPPQGIPSSGISAQVPANWGDRE